MHGLCNSGAIGLCNSQYTSVLLVMPRILWCVWTCGVKLNKHSSYLTSTHSNPQVILDQITDGLQS